MLQALQTLAQVPTGRNSTDVRLSGGHVTYAPGTDRRRILGAITMTGAAFICGPAAAAEVLAADALHRQDAIFWVRHAQWKAIEAQWNAAFDDDDAVMDSWNAKYSEAHHTVVFTPVTTGAALAAKLASLDWDPGNYQWSDEQSTLDMIRRDLTGMTKGAMA